MLTAKRAFMTGLLAACTMLTGTTCIRVARAEAALSVTRTVVGKVAPAAGSPAFDPEACLAQINMWSPPPPPEARQAGREAVLKWREEWLQSPEGKAQAHLKDYVVWVLIKPHGSFLIPDVPAGKLTFSVDVFAVEKGSDGRNRPTGRTLRHASKTFEVAAAPAGKEGEPLDIGTLEVELPKDARTGVTAGANATSATLAREPERTLAGVALAADGQPAAGAEVVLCEPSGRTSVYQFYGNEGLSPMAGLWQAPPTFKTGPDGRFEFKTRARYFGLVVRHGSGVAIENEETLPKDGRVRVHPWGRVEGVLREGSKVIPNHEVRINYPLARSARPVSRNTRDYPQIFFSHTARTDAQGRFVFERVHSGPARIGARVDQGNGTWSYTPSFEFEIKPQGTTVFNLGGAGRAVTGRITLQAGSDTSYKVERCEVRLQPFVPDPPEAVRKQGRDAYEQWRAEWEKTPEAKTWLARKDYRREATPDKDGAFRISDVPEGKYMLGVFAHEWRERRLTTGAFRVVRTQRVWETLGEARRDFEIAPMPGGRSDAPLDLGRLELKIPARNKE